MFDFGFIDAHCHLADPTLNKDFLDIDSKKTDISGFISSALSKEEFIWHQKNKHIKIKWIAGIHPTYEKSKLEDLNAIIDLCETKQIIGIGEIGLDSRNNNRDYQKKILLEQLAIAQEFELPVVFHVVKEYYSLAKILKNNFPKTRGYLHGFNSSKDVMKLFLDFDLAFSLNCRPPKIDVIQNISRYGHFLFETDAPYQKPIGYENEFNPLSNINWIIDHVSKVTKLNREELKILQYNSLNKIFG